MPHHQDRPTSLPNGPLRTCLERIQAEIVNELNNAQSQYATGEATVDNIQLQHWINRLTEAIHFNGQIPTAITGVENEPHAFADLDNAYRHLSYIQGKQLIPLHAAEAMELIGKFRLKMSSSMAKVEDKLRRWTDRMLLTFDVDAAQADVKEAHRIITQDVMGVR